jgi:heptosyltransferase III
VFSLSKRLEHILKYTAAVLLGVLFLRPFRRRQVRAQTPEKPTRVLLVRTDNRVGEALLLTPLITACAQRGFLVEALVHQKMKRVLDGTSGLERLHERSWKTLWSLRSTEFDAVVNCSNWTAVSIGNALCARFVAPRALVCGPQKFPVSMLADVCVLARADTSHEVLQRLHLCSPLFSKGFDSDAYALTFRKTPSYETPVKPPYAIVNPGGRLGVRRVSPGVFASAARALVNRGISVLVTWGPGEEPLAREVVTRTARKRFWPPPQALMNWPAFFAGPCAR